MEIEQKYERKMRALRDELDLRRKTELHEVEERKNAQINTLMRNHEKAFSDIKNYYNDITLNNLALINTLKVTDFKLQFNGFNIIMMLDSRLKSVLPDCSHFLLSQNKFIDWNTLLVTINLTQPINYINLLMFPSPSETFIRTNWYSVLSDLDMTRSYHVKKAVICMAELIAALVSIYGLLTFLVDI